MISPPSAQNPNPLLPLEDRTSVHARINRQHDASLEAVREYVRQPSFSDTGEGILECAEYTRALLARIAPDARVVQTAGYPVVFGQVRSNRIGAPTLIVYGLYDTTPTVREEWTVDPSSAPIVDARALGILPHLGEVLVGRGVNNHKGPVLASILALEALLAEGHSPAVNLIYVIEGEEEIGSPSLAGFVEAHRDVLEQAQGVWLPCMQQNSGGTMTLRRAYKGILFGTLSCKGGEWGGARDGRHLWAGHSAWIDAPLMQLVRALATLYDDAQRVTVDGLLERTPPNPAPNSPEVVALEEMFLSHPEWEKSILTNLNVARYLGGGRLSDHLAHYMLAPTLNLQGIVGGYTGPTYYTQMPGQAQAKFDLRFPPGIDFQEVETLVNAHLERRGYPHVRVTDARGYAGSPALPEDEDSLLTAARDAAAKYRVRIDVWPIANNCCPAALFTALGTQLPFSIAGLGHGDRAHAPDEYITVGSVDLLMHWTIDYLDSWAECKRMSH